MFNERTLVGPIECAVKLQMSKWFLW